MTLIQTGKIERFPVILFGSKYWKRVIDFSFLVEEGVIAPKDIELFSYADTAEEAFNIVQLWIDRGLLDGGHKIKN